jgi:hypothetical protein
MGSGDFPDARISAGAQDCRMSPVTCLRRCAVALPVLLAGLAATTGSASAYGTVYANFSATISGSYANDGTLTSANCFRYDDEGGDRVVLPAMTGKHAERTSFRSVRPTLLGFEKPRSRKTITAGGMPVPVDVKMDRRSELSGGTEVRGCTPIGDRFDTRCGTATKRFQLDLFAVRAKRALSYNLSNGFSTVFPDDPFECPVADSSHWWGGSYSRGNGMAKLPSAKLFDRSVRRIVLHGSLTERTGDARPDEGWEASGTETLRWTVVLVRRK